MRAAEEERKELECVAGHQIGVVCSEQQGRLKYKFACDVGLCVLHRSAKSWQFSDQNSSSSFQT